MVLSRLVDLKHVMLLGCFTADTRITLQPGCMLRLEAYAGPRIWEQQRRSIAKHTSLLQLGQFQLGKWPLGIERFSVLQYFELDCALSRRRQRLQIAVLKHIPTSICA